MAGGFVKRMKPRKMIKKDNLVDWVASRVTNEIHNMTSDNESFNKWAENFEKEEALFVADMELLPYWGEDIIKRNEFKNDEVKEYASMILNKILDAWYL